jgi:hypothetical protein
MVRAKAQEFKQKGDVEGQKIWTEVADEIEGRSFPSREQRSTSGSS